jgi:hypothetical protein
MKSLLIASFLITSAIISTANADTNITGQYVTEKVYCSSNNQPQAFTNTVTIFGSNGQFYAEDLDHGCKFWERTTYSVKGEIITLGSSTLQNNCGQYTQSIPIRTAKYKFDGNVMTLGIMQVLCDHNRGYMVWQNRKVRK